MIVRKKEDRLIVAGTAIAVFAVLFVLFIMPQIRQLSALRRQHVSERELIEKRAVIMDRLDDFRVIADGWQNKADQMERKFLKPEEVPGYFNRINKVARDAKVVIKTVDPSDQKEPARLGIKSMFIKVDVEGKYVYVADFIKRLMNEINMIDIGEMKMYRRENGQVDASFIITLFVLDEK